MPPPAIPPTNFLEILQQVWWRLDRALDLAAIECSAQIGALAALHCGTTTLIDHHASPSAIESSLDAVESGIGAAGLRALLCYETTDRHGPAGAKAGLHENARYLQKCAARRDHRFAALVGAHASFTLEESTLDSLRALAHQFNVGLHIHLAEDPCDQRLSRERFHSTLLERFERHALLHPANIFAHGTHLPPDFIARINDSRVSLAHNTRSTMNNSVGYAPLHQLHAPILLGTDGIGGDMIAEAQTAWFKSQDAHAGLSPTHIIAMLAASARRASLSLGVTLGKLVPTAAADILITRYHPFTPLTSDNLPAHLLFALSSHHVQHVLINGGWALKDRTALHCDEPALLASARNLSTKLWNRMKDDALDHGFI